MPIVNVLKCVVAERFRSRMRDGEEVIRGRIMEAGGAGTQNVSSGSAAGPSTSDASASGDVGHSHSKFYVVYVNQDIKDVKFREDILALDTRTRLIFTNVMIYTESIRLTPKSKMLTNVSEFGYDMKEMDNFMKPNVVSVAEAKGSPKKRRLSVEGDITRVGECISTNTYSRRSIEIASGGASMEVILWGETARKKLHVSKGVTINAVMKEDRRLSSTDCTTIEMSNVMDGSGTIIGIADVDAGYPVEVILESGDMLYVGENVAVDLQIMTLPAEVKYRATEQGMVEMMEIVEKGDPKV